MGYTGTLEGEGPNTLGTTGGSVKDLGYTWIGNNANGNPPFPPISTGIRGSQWEAGAGAAVSLSNESVKTADTQVHEAGQGTLENGNDNGANWR